MVWMDYLSRIFLVYPMRGKKANLEYLVNLRYILRVFMKGMMMILAIKKIRRAKNI
jgi:hypothetical protein